MQSFSLWDMHIHSKSHQNLSTIFHAIGQLKEIEWQKTDLLHTKTNPQI